MGYIKHHSIIVVGSEKNVRIVNRKAKELIGHLVSNVINTRMNAYYSFFVSPDGSKEGWEDSNYYELKRQELFDFVYSTDYVDIIEVKFGGDEPNLHEITNVNNLPF